MQNLIHRRRWRVRRKETSIMVVEKGGGNHADWAACLGWMYVGCYSAMWGDLKGKQEGVKLHTRLWSSDFLA